MSDPPCFPGRAHPGTCWLEDTDQLVVVSCTPVSVYPQCMRGCQNLLSAASRLASRISSRCKSSSSCRWQQHLGWKGSHVAGPVLRVGAQFGLQLGTPLLGKGVIGMVGGQWMSFCVLIPHCPAVSESRIQRTASGDGALGW